MVLGPVRGFDHGLLLLKFFLDAASLSHTSGKRHGRNGQHCCPSLYRKKRLILTLINEWPKAVQRSPHRYYRQNENAGRGFPLSEAERGPNDNRPANKSDGIVFG